MFRAEDEKGQLYENDKKFIEELQQYGLDYILQNICGLDAPEYRELIVLIKHAYGLLNAWKKRQRSPLGSRINLPHQ